ncbi:hypothetical protein H2509_12625 [Stappia sp. F7233]|uniref:Group 1 truncated hemoglobin n=1 Tax=Stappia albiluteola TaxID=2758565 RepID=A0A839AG11_9HYPH|nr:hypothetical protein [Stappia albiluteola]MBA5777968.1 hypothetical protein [Stappia albiluteola]
MTLYLRLGGRPAIEAAVSSLLRRLREDSLFAGQPHSPLRTCPREGLTEFLVYIFAGSPTYEGRALGEAHGGLFLDTPRYDRFVDHLVSIFSNDGTNARIAIEARYVLERVRPFVLNSPQVIEA